MFNLKKIVIFASFIALLLLSGFESKAACPEGTETAFPVITVNGCDYNVQVCYKCEPTGGYDGWISVFGFGKIGNCTQTWNASQVLADINRQLNDPSYFNALCNLGVKPCDGSQGDTYWEFAEEICWKKYNNNGNIWYEACTSPNNCYCLTVWKWCWNGSSYEETIYYGPSRSGYFYCTDTEPQNPQPGDSTGCFYLITRCYPYN